MVEYRREFGDKPPITFVYARGGKRVESSADVGRSWLLEKSSDGFECRERLSRP